MTPPVRAPPCLPAQSRAAQSLGTPGKGVAGGLQRQLVR